jgi:hemerythrin-like domain-containing protein
MPATEILVDEHRLISRMVNVLTVLHKSLESGDGADLSVLMDVVNFFQTFVDKNHHAKEDALFLILERRQVNPKECTIESLENEHKQGTTLMATLTAEIGRYKADDPASKSRICGTIRDAIKLYNDHIWRENILLFPIADKTLQEPESIEAMKTYRQIDEMLGAAFRAKYEQLVSALEKATHASHVTT